MSAQVTGICRASTSPCCEALSVVYTDYTDLKVLEQISSQASSHWSPHNVVYGKEFVVLLYTIRL